MKYKIKKKNNKTENAIDKLNNNAAHSKNLINTEEATDFPRGGAKTLTALEVRELREQAEKDFEAGIPLDSDEELNTEHSKKRKRKSEKILKSNKKEKLFLNTKPNSIISTLTFKKLSVGMTLLGVVKEINDLDLVISLPNQLTGFVAITEISDFITEKVENAAKIEEEEDLEDSIPDLRELFEVGEYVVCAIINLENTTAAKKRVELSLNPKIVNISLKAPDISAGMNLMGTILSEEDHGYIIDLGIENSAGFLNKKGIEGQSKKFKDGAFKVGQLLLSQVSKVEQGSKIIKLTVENESLKKNVISSTEKISFESLKPGFLIQGKVKESNENGIIVSFHDLFHGTVDVFHVGHLVQNIEVDLEQKFKEGQKLKCRIIYVDEAKKRIGLSLNSNILHLSVDPLSADINKQVGSKLALRVIRIEHGKGVILASEDDTCVCYAHKSRISDNSDYKFEDKKFKIGSIQEARIIALNPFDNIYSVSLQKSVLDQTFFQLKDITVGVVVKAKILRLTAKGIVCSVTDSINGFIPKLHMSDVILQDPSKLFKVGAIIKCQVLLCDPSERRLILTHKKSLLNSKLPKLVNYNDITEGTITCGVINSITNFGCFISFFGSVSGFAHISELSEDFLKHPAEMFKIGQTVKCKVLGKTDDKLRLTLKISQNSVPFIKSLHSGQIVSGTIISKTNQCFVIKLKDTGCKGVLPFKHLSDHNSESHISKLADALKEGMMLEKLVVMEINKLSGEILLSKKPTLIHYANEKGSELLIDVNALEPSLTIPGFVKKILDKGCIIGFVGGLQGFAKMHSISDRFVANISEHVSLNQTVLATISSVDKENGKFFVDLKNSLNFPNAFSVKPNNYEIEFLNSLFVEKDFIFPSTTSSSCMKFGDPIKVSVKQIVPYGVIVNIPSNEALSGLITTYQTFGKVLKVGEDILARVLDIDWEKKIVDLSLNHVVPLTGNTKKLQQAYESFKVLDAQIEVIKEDYLVASLTSLENLLCFVSVKTLNSVETPFSKFKSGQNIKVIITKLPEKISGTLHAERLLAVVRESKSVNNEKFEFRKKLKNSVDSKIEYLDDVVIGLSLKGKVKSVKTTQINVELAGNLFGRVHLFEIPQPHNETSNKTHPFKGIRQGDVIDCKVIGFRDTKTHNYLPITKKTSPQFLIVDLTMKQADLDLPDLQLTCVGDSRYIQFNTINIGDEISGFVQRVEKDAVWCQISPNLQGRCFILECSEKIKILENLANNFKEGQSIRCTVIAKDNVKNSVDLTFKDESMRSLQVEKIVPGIISDIKKESGLTVQLGARSYGRVHLTDIRDKFTDNPTKGFIKGELVNCFILNKTDDKIDLSLRPSRLVRNKTKKTDSVNREIKSINDLVVGELCEGYIKNISDGGVFVSVNRNLSGRVQIRNLSDLYIKDWKNLFQKGQFVKGKIIDVDQDSQRFELTLKPSDLDPSVIESLLTLESLAIGEKVKGVITKIERYGAFVKIHNSNLSGLCHSSEISDEPVSDISKLFTVGDIVKAIVLEVNIKSKRISLGLKASYFDDADAMDIDTTFNENQLENLDSKENLLENRELDMKVNDDTQPKKNLPDDNMDVDIIALMKDVEPLSFDAESEEENADVMEESDNESESEEDTKKKSRAEKKKEKKELEQLTVAKEQLIASGDAAPTTTDDYERLLLGSPNSSFIWIKYMAHQFQLAEIEKARQVAERALKSISFREEKEKLNVWVAFMNLENSYGTSESLKKVFDRACLANDPKTIYLQLAQIYIRTEKKLLAEELYTAMLKRFKQSSKVWTSAGLFYLQNSKVEESRLVLQRSLKSLPKHKHIKTITKFGQFEYKFGEPERGRTIFEGILSNYPKRIDLWNVYLDQEIKTEDVQNIRRLFERVITMKFSSKKMKFFFKKYLNFETSLGEDGDVDHVKEAALTYVESLDK